MTALVPYPTADRFAVTVRPGEHACCHFSDAGDRERLAVAFIHDALGRGDKVLYLFDGAGPAALVSRLEKLDPALEPARERGQFEARRDAYIRDGQFDPDRILAMLREEREHARADGWAGLSVAGEVPFAVCESAGGEQLGDYEARLDRDADAGGYSILCQYDHERFRDGCLWGVIEAHDVEASPELAPIGRDGALAAARDRAEDALRLAGELDFASAQTVCDVLDAHFAGPLRLDLADLSYVDVAGMRALRGRNGQRVTISRVSEPVARLVTLLGWETDPAVEFVEAR
jgi:ABC-type transporter Mla MlaB component